MHARVYENRGSLRMFAITRRIPYTRQYPAWKSESGNGHAGTDASMDAGQMPIETEDADQVFLTDEQVIEAARIKDKIIKTVKKIQFTTPNSF